ncbi:PDK [Symbiodinium natans]|uniref:PDK protein n=1 Tax=Symbiodinium natans TaxID=878477 RepID=A0A812V5M7_9DINO|nr:PDK [Symbiodinium natans]
MARPDAEVAVGLARHVPAPASLACSGAGVWHGWCSWRSRLGQVEISSRGSVSKMQLPDCCARKPCPPSIADRPKTCQPESKAHLDAINALFYQASSVYFLTANCYETAEEEPKELLPILNFLTDMGDLLCYTRHMDCQYGSTPEHLDLLRYLIVELEVQCLQMEFCQDVLKEGHFHEDMAFGQGRLFGEALDRMAATAAKLLWKNQRRATAPSLATVLYHASTWTLGAGSVTDFDPCGPGLRPRRVHLLNGEIADHSSSHAIFLSTSRVLEVFNSPGRDFGRAPMVVNLGAGSHDPANCLLEFSGDFRAILFEINPERVEELRRRFGRRPEVTLFTELVDPASFAEVLLQFVPDPPSQRFPALLKIDVDNGDCDYLAVWLKAGYLPLVINMEVVHSYLPPEIALSIPFDPAKSNGNISQQYSYAEDMMLVGCSLGAMLEILRSQYSLLSWSHFKAINVEFILTSWSQEQRIEVVPTEEIPAFWRRVVSYREVFHADNYHGLELDPRLMVSDSLSVEEKLEILEDAQHAARQQGDPDGVGV